MTGNKYMAPGDRKQHFSPTFTNTRRDGWWSRLFPSADPSNPTDGIRICDTEPKKKALVDRLYIKKWDQYEQVNRLSPLRSLVLQSTALQKQSDITARDYNEKLTGVQRMLHACLDGAEHDRGLIQQAIISNADPEAAYVQYFANLYNCYTHSEQIINHHPSFDIFSIPIAREKTRLRCAILELDGESLITPVTEKVRKK